MTWTSTTIPSRVVDLTNKTFGKLKVFNYEGTIKGAAVWLCKCSCDGPKSLRTIKGAELTRGKTQTCGCERIASTTNEIGNRYGRLLVTERSNHKEASYRRVFWICKCDCGKSKLCTGTELRQHKTNSCGCLKSETFDERQEKELESIFGGDDETTNNS